MRLFAVALAMLSAPLNPHMPQITLGVCNRALTTRDAHGRYDRRRCRIDTI
jgi:hypothetical protein